MKFDDDIPVPATMDRRSYAGIRDMKVGQSFFVAAAPTGKVSKSVHYYTRTLGWKLVCRTVVENGVKGVRVWRVS